MNNPAEIWSRSSWTTHNPGLIVILLDTSVLMSQRLDGTSTSLSAKASKFVNRIIDSIIQTNYNGDRVSDRCYIQIIGYSEDIQELKSGYLSDFDNAPLRTKVTRKTISDGAGGFVEIDAQEPIWLDPINGVDSCKILIGFKAAEAALHQWYLLNKYSPAPIIIHITNQESVKKMLPLPKERQHTTEIFERITHMRFLNNEHPHVMNIIMNGNLLASEEIKSFIESISSKYPDEYLYKYGSERLNKEYCIFTSDDTDLFSLTNWMVYR